MLHIEAIVERLMVSKPRAQLVGHLLTVRGNLLDHIDQFRRQELLERVRPGQSNRPGMTGSDADQTTHCSIIPKYIPGLLQYLNNRIVASQPSIDELLFRSTTVTDRDPLEKGRSRTRRPCRLP